MIRKILGLFSLFIALGSAYVYYLNYWRWRELFNDQGRYYHAEEQWVYLEQAGIIWSSFAVFFYRNFVTLASWLVVFPDDYAELRQR